MGLKEFNLSGKVAVVTGAGKGLGEQIALALAEAGADLALVGRNRRNLEAVAAGTRRMGRRVIVIRADVRREKDVARMARQAYESFKRIDILVNNAGVIQRAPAMKISLRDWQEVIDTNLTGPFLCMKACQPIMARQGGGGIINMSSGAGLFGRANMSSYCASKAGLANLTRALAIEWAKDKIRVNAIAPGQFETDMGAPLLNDKKALREFMKNIPLRRIGKPREIGLWAVMLASDAAAYMTGQVVVVDGGMTAS
ncbi:MAG: SDR family oxidoreductase [Syntrophales bacterium LBB04]|nr:SDR family oxidoreductase [Syntrophales bacterium LBB04]